MTGHSQLINVCSSRSVCAQLVLINSSMLKRVESMNSPTVRNLVSWVRFHEEKGMFIEIDEQTAKEMRIVCHKCYALGHKGPEGPRGAMQYRKDSHLHALSEAAPPSKLLPGHQERRPFPGRPGSQEATASQEARRDFFHSRDCFH